MDIQKKKEFIKQQKLSVMICLAAVLIVMLFAGFQAVKSVGRANLRKASSENSGGVVSYKGEEYKYNDSISTVLLMGIDSEETVEKSSFINSGQSDVMLLVALDHKNKKISIISICRDAMIDLKEYNSAGKFRGTTRGQIALQYANGNGKDTSGRMAVDAISELFFGIPVHGYGAVHFVAVSSINDAVGGVEVTVPEDDKDYISLSGYEGGEKIVLKGDKATEFVQSRNEYTGFSNSIRMSRQRLYLNGFIEAVKKSTRRNIFTPIKIFNKAKAYVNTDISPTALIYIASAFNDYSFEEADIYSVPGENTKPNKYVEFVVDDETLREMVLNIFYEKV